MTSCALENVMTEKLPLSGVRVIDCSRVLAGPYAAMILADFGADVIKVERPGLGDDTRRWGPPFVGGESAYYLSVNRNKRSMTLNLKDERGKAILRRLVREADVLIENFKTGTFDRLGIGYEDLRKINPGLVYCSITGYGTTGPYAETPGYDFMIQAAGGIMSITGPADGEPYKVGVAIVDVSTGLYAANAIQAALRHRDRTGVGQRVDVSLFESQISWLINVAESYLVSGNPPRRYGNAHPNIVPYETFPTADGYIAVGAGNDAQFKRLCAILDLDTLPDDPRFRTNPNRVRYRDELIPLLRERFQTRPAAEWLQLLGRANIPCAPINTIDRVFSHPQTRARDMIIEVPHPTAGRVKLIGLPYKLSRTPLGVYRHPPLLGEHTEEILHELGFDDEAIAHLRAEKVI